MSQLAQDFRYALRVLAKSPGFTAVAVLTLGLAIGANTAIFSIANALLLKPLPFPHPEQLLEVMRHFPQGDASSVSIPRFLFVRDHARSFSHVATYDMLGSGFNLAGDGRPERIVGSRVSREFFTVFGAAPALGRDFLPEEDRPGARRVVVLSDGVFHRRFGGDPKLIGRGVRLNGETYTVVGVMPASFRFPTASEVWTPLQVDPASEEKANYLELVGRLAPGVTPAAADAEMKVLGRRFYAQKVAGETSDDPRVSFRVRPLAERLYGRLRPAVLVLLAAVGCVLLIACVNIANLELARAAARRREIAIRSALGAGGRRIAAQLLAESVVLGLLGGAAGLVLGMAGLQGLVAVRPAALDRLLPLSSVGIDGHVLAFTFGVALASGLLFGLVPALQAARGDLTDPLKEGSQRTTGGIGGLRTRRILVVSETALALVLLTGASLLVESFAGLVGTQPGFATDHLLAMKLSFPLARYGNAAALDRFGRQVVARAEGLPGVAGAALATSLPMEPGPDLPFIIEGRWKGGRGTANADGEHEGEGGAQYRGVTPRFFAALGIPVVAGRALTAADGAGRELVAVVNQTLARKYFPKQSPIGRRLHVGLPDVPELADPAPRTIVGVVRDVRELGLDEQAPPLLYVPIAQMPPAITQKLVELLPLSLVVKTAAAPGTIAPAVEREIWAVDPEQPVADVEPVEAIVGRSLGLQRFEAVLLGFLAVAALALAAVGIYGVLSYLVTQRTREIGIRMALGATAGYVQRLVLSSGLSAVAVGVAIGLAGALALTRLLASLLVNVSARDPVAFLLAPAILAAVAVLAGGLPARRASRMDPVRALRQE
jgi:putative ABC transport system permease protein